MDPNQITTIILCAGKLYYELLKERQSQLITNTAIIRIEQLYPFPVEDLQQIISRYPAANQLVWAQEEPRNQGAWYYMQSKRTLKAVMHSGHTLRYAGRNYSASPAAGSLHIHREQQESLIKDALGLGDNANNTILRTI